MAHQAHAIPWQTLAKNLKFKHCNPRNHGITNLYLRCTRPEMGNELQYFVSGFVGALSRYSTIERTKYESVKTIPDPEDRVIQENAVKKMASTVLRYRGEQVGKPSTDSRNTALSTYDCTAQRFISDTYPCEGDMCDGRADLCEQTKTMLLYGEMDSLFQLAAHPNVHFNKLWDECEYANAHGFGLSKLKDSAIQAYLCLNVMFLQPELYDQASRLAYIDAEAKANRSTVQPRFYDYRLTAAYQRMLLCCTGIRYGSGLHEAHTYPHREFFGIPRGMLYIRNGYIGQNKSKPGTVRVSGLAEYQYLGFHVPSKADVPAVLGLLKAKGMPTELSLQIMDLADYKPLGRLYIRDDPLHIANAEELRKYLSYCWILLVRIDMLVKASGRWLDWEAEVTDALCTLFEMDSPRRRKFQELANRDTEFSTRTHRMVFK